ncbi:hypothetical protein N2152v2_009395 [Parachlorella kessleri]
MDTGELDIVLASRVARQSVPEPYWRQRTKSAAGTDGAETAKLRKQLAATSKDFSTLLSLQQKSDAQLSDLQAKIKMLRQEVAAKDKQLDLCRRTIDRLTDERAQSEGNAAAQKAYISKLEARLLSVKNTVELQSKCTEYKCQAEHMAQQLRLAEGRAAAAEVARQRQQEEAAFLRRGIDLAAEQLTKSGTGEVPAALLVSLARAQEESISLSVQLADSQQQLAQMASALQHARAHLLEQQKSLEEVQRDGKQSSQDLHAVRSELEAERVALAEQRHVTASLRKQVTALKDERERLRHELELERTATATADEKVRELQAACKKQAKTEDTLQKQLRELKAAAQHQQQRQEQHQLQQPQPADLAGHPGSRLEERAPDRARRAAAGGLVSSSSQVTGTRAAQGALSRSAGQAASQAQRLQQLREQRRLGRGSPVVGSRPSSGPAHATFDVQRHRQQQEGARSLGLASVHLGDEREALLQEASLSHPMALEQDSAGRLCEPLSRPSAPERRAARPAVAAEARPAAAVLDHRATQPAQRYVSALDEQIAQLEGDLEQLTASCSPTKLQRLLLHGLEREPTLTEEVPQPGAAAATGSARQLPPQGQQRVPLRPRQAAVPAPVKAGHHGGLEEPADFISPSKPQRKKPAQAGAAATAKQQLSPAKLLHHPSPSKLLQPGWLAGASQPPQQHTVQEPHSRQGSPGIPAWRPNVAFEPVLDADAMVLHASMPEPPPSLHWPRPPWQLPATTPAAATQVGRQVLPAAAPAGRVQPSSSQPPLVVEIPSAGACDRYTGTIDVQPLPPSNLETPPLPSAADASLQAPPQSTDTQGTVWHSNPLAAASPIGSSRTQPEVGNHAPRTASAAATAHGDWAQPGHLEVTAGPAALHKQEQEQQREEPHPHQDGYHCAYTKVPSCAASSSGRSLSSGQREGDFAEFPEPRGAQQLQQGEPVAAAAAGQQQRLGSQEAGRDWWEEEFENLQWENLSPPAAPLLRQQQRGSSQGQCPQQHWQQQEWVADRPRSVAGQATAGEQQPSTQAATLQDDCCTGTAPPPLLQQAQRPASRGSLVTFSRHWSGAPSGATSWLGAAYEPDIEQLEVTSARKPLLAACQTEQEQQHVVEGGQDKERGVGVQSARHSGLATLLELATGDLDWDCL